MDIYSEFLLKLGYAMPRMLALFAIVPFFSRAILGGVIVRNAVALAIVLFLMPVLDYEAAVSQFEIWQLGLILVKELLVGVFFGFLLSLPFWAVEGVGILIDNQRGASMSSALNPMSGSEASPLGMLLMQYSVVLFFISGGHLLFFNALYGSYLLWPVFDSFPQIQPGAYAKIIKEFSLFFVGVILMSSPVVIAMFLSEFGLGLVNRFAPQLNVYFLSMSLKSGVALFVLIVYLQVLFDIFGDDLIASSGTLEKLRDIFI